MLRGGEVIGVMGGELVWSLVWWVMGELMHTCGRMILAKMWWVDWGPKVVGSWGQVWWVVECLVKVVVGGEVVGGKVW